MPALLYSSAASDAHKGRGDACAIGRPSNPSNRAVASHKLQYLLTRNRIPDIRDSIALFVKPVSCGDACSIGRPCNGAELTIGRHKIQLAPTCDRITDLGHTREPDVWPVR